MSEQTIPVPEESSEYDDLPEAVRQYYSRTEYLWLSEHRKQLLLQDETEPEWTLPRRRPPYIFTAMNRTS